MAKHKSDSDIFDYIEEQDILLNKQRKYFSSLCKAYFGKSMNEIKEIVFMKNFQSTLMGRAF